MHALDALSAFTTVVVDTADLGRVSRWRMAADKLAEGVRLFSAETVALLQMLA